MSKHVIGLAGLSQLCFSAGLDLVSKSLVERLIVKSGMDDHAVVATDKTKNIALDSSIT